MPPQPFQECLIGEGNGWLVIGPQGFQGFYTLGCEWKRLLVWLQSCLEVRIDMDDAGFRQLPFGRIKFDHRDGDHHPIDLPMADQEDIALTRAIVKACWAVEIPVIDHIIIGKSGLLSMKRHLPEIFEGEDEIA